MITCYNQVDKTERRDRPSQGGGDRRDRPSQGGGDRRDRPSQGGGGIFCYVPENLTYKRQNDLETKGTENCWLEVMHACSENNLISFFYSPPDSSIDWFDSFSETLENVSHMKAKKF